VIEHVRDPKGLFGEMVQAAKPGGLLYVRVPHVPSPLKRCDIHCRGAFKWHAAWLAGLALGTLAFRLFGAPKEAADEGAGKVVFACPLAYAF
jgi:hypothetical protein